MNSNQCYKCQRDLRSAEGMIIRIEDETYEFECRLCRYCRTRIQEILEISGYTDEEEKP